MSDPVPNDGAATPALMRPLVTPEGVELRLRLAGAGERAAAFLIDAAIIVAALAAVTVAAGALAAARHGTALAGLVWLAGSFVLRNCYFAIFEVRGRAATPGKRALGLRVISRSGGRLSADAVLGRNLMRELEVFMPIDVALWGAGATGWAVIAGLLWSGVFGLFPLLNRDRMRVGDLLAGTWVVHVPRRALLPDMGEGGLTFGHAFTAKQAAAYGVRELHILEAVLRSGDPGTMAAVAERIRRRIGWDGASSGDEAFLSAYYGALRARLERRLLFGHRRRDKHDDA